MQDLSVDMRGTFYWRRDTLQRLAGLSNKKSQSGWAWVIESGGARREINSGELITRADAERLAAAGEYTLDTDV